jgi:invasion protein IalB
MSRASSIAAAALLLAMAGAAYGEVQEIAPWRVECTSDGKILDCRAFLQVVDRAPNRPDQLIVAVIVRRPAESKQPLMVIQFPLGLLNLTEPIQIRVDNGPVDSQPIQTCANVGCLANFTLNDKFLAAMRSGKELKVTGQNIVKKPLELPLPLLGFALAYDKVK